MASFEIAYEKTKGLEGVKNKPVYALLKNDGGGETYGGLSRKFNPEFTGWPVIDVEKKKRGGKIPNNTYLPQLDSALKKFYFDRYWILQAKGDKIINQDVANFVFDTVVNHGAGEVVINDGVKDAGFRIAARKAITSDTLNALNSAPVTVYPYLYKSRLNYIKSLHDFIFFGPGWLNRLKKFPETITKNSGGGGSLITVFIIFLIVAVILTGIIKI